MTKLTREAVKDFIEKRYLDKIITIEIINDSETMAFVLMYSNASVVTRAVVDINSEGKIDVWSLERAHFEEFYNRREDI